MAATDSQELPLLDAFTGLSTGQVKAASRGALAALFVAALGNTVVVTALPVIIDDLGGFDLYAWPSTAYMVSSMAAMPIAGRLADIFGRRALFLAGIVLFTATSVAVGLSQSMEQLIGFRFLQGIGGGAIIVNCVASIADLFPPEERARYHGLVGLVMMLATIVGPAVGGVIVDNFHWSWTFFVNVPGGLLIFLALLRFLPRVTRSARATDADERPAVDYFGIATLTIAVCAIMTALSAAGPIYRWGSWQILGLLLLGALTTAAFLRRQIAAPFPIMPLGIYRSRVLSVSVAISFLVGFALYSSILMIPLFFQAVQGASATSSGLFLLPIIFGIVIGAVASGELLSRVGGTYRRYGLASTALIVAGMFFLSTMNAETAPVVAVVYNLLLGVGLGVSLSTFTVAAQNAMGQEDIGVATGAVQFFRAWGGTTGVAVAGAVMTQRRTVRQVVEDSATALGGAVGDALKVGMAIVALALAASCLLRGARAHSR